jgi:hypothetical protein
LLSLLSPSLLSLPRVTLLLLLRTKPPLQLLLLLVGWWCFIGQDTDPLDFRHPLRQDTRCTHQKVPVSHPGQALIGPPRIDHMKARHNSPGTAFCCFGGALYTHTALRCTVMHCTSLSHLSHEPLAMISLVVSGADAVGTAIITARQVAQ